MEATALNKSGNVIEVESLNVGKFSLKGIKISISSEMTDSTVERVSGLLETLAGHFMDGLKLVEGHEERASIRRMEERKSDREHETQERERREAREDERLAREERRERKFKRDLDDVIA